MFASPARRTLDVMSLAARLTWLRSEVKAPVAAGWPIIPSRMYVSSVMPARDGAGANDGLALLWSLDMGASAFSRARSAAQAVRFAHILSAGTSCRDVHAMGVGSRPATRYQVAACPG